MEEKERGDAHARLRRFIALDADYIQRNRSSAENTLVNGCCVAIVPIWIQSKGKVRKWATTCYSCRIARPESTWSRSRCFHVGVRVGVANNSSTPQPCLGDPRDIFWDLKVL